MFITTKPKNEMIDLLIFKFIKTLIKTLVILSFCVFNFSCSSTKTETPTNICTLTPEQAPEVRGLNLGMTQEQIKQKFPDLFEEYKSSFDEDTLKTEDLSEIYKKISNASEKKDRIRLLEATTYKENFDKIKMCESASALFSTKVIFYP